MNDIELSYCVSAEIGKLYEEGKTVSRELPGYTLVCLRSVASAFCHALDQELGHNIDLIKKIQSLESQQLITSSICGKLHSLRINGNKGAHPEKFDHSNLDLPSLAESSLAAARELVEFLYPLVKAGETVPKYETIEPPSSEWRSICYKAMLENNPDSQYLAGLYLQEKAKDLTPTTGICRSTDRYSLEAAPFIDQAVLMFKLGAKQEHTNCMYQYGLYQSKLSCDGYGRDIEAVRKEGEFYIWRASVDGNADALSTMGSLYFSGSLQYEQDYELAYEAYKSAADQEHPEALAQLGYMHNQGLGCSQDAVLAAQYSLKSAEAGYPQGQYNTYIFYVRGNGIEKNDAEALTWLNAAVKQEYPPAILAYATLIMDGQLPKQSIVEIKDLLSQCLVQEDLKSRALLKIATLESDEPNVEAWIAAAHHVQDCYEIIINDGDPHGLKDECLKVALKVATVLRSGIQTNSHLQDLELGTNRLLACCLFDSKGVPIKDKKKFSDEYSDLMSQALDGTPNALEKLQQFTRNNAHLAHKAPLTVNNSKLNKIGRNEPCSCGSGKKYKNCCIKGGGILALI